MHITNVFMLSFLKVTIVLRIKLLRNIHTYKEDKDLTIIVDGQLNKCIENI